MKLVFVIAVVVLAVAATVSADHSCPACDDQFQGFGTEPGKCGCCPWPCCCKCIPTTCDPSTTPMACGCIDLTFLLDSSGSIGSLAWSISLQFLVDIVTALETFNLDCPNEIKVAPITFGDNATLHWNLEDSENDNLQSIVTELLAINKTSGRTNLVEAMEIAIDDVYTNYTSDCAKVVVIVTDGKANVDEEYIPDLALELQALTDQIFCIGVTNKINVTQLLMICDEVLDVNDFQTLNSTSLEFLQPVLLPTPAPCDGESCFCCCTVEQFWGGAAAYQ